MVQKPSFQTVFRWYADTMDQIPVVRIAELTVESLITRNQEPDISSYHSGPLTHQRACYVSIFENPGHRLQAMFGRPVPTKTALA